jgi:hypothetical protein
MTEQKPTIILELKKSPVPIHLKCFLSHGNELIQVSWRNAFTK